MKTLAYVHTVSVLAFFAAGLSGCGQPKTSCGDGTSCSPSTPVITLTLSGPLPPAATVTACHLSACLTAELPSSSAGGAFTLSTRPVVSGAVSGGGQPVLAIDWYGITASTGDTFSVTVNDAAGRALATIAEIATYMSQFTGSGPCGQLCQTLVMTPFTPPQDAGSPPPPNPLVTCRPAAPCPPGWLKYEDTVCSPPGQTGASSCTSNGDNLCYLPCSNDAVCRTAGLTSCGSITFFHGSDAGSQVPVCTGTAQLPLCSADAGTDAGKGGTDAGGAASFFCFRSTTAPADAGDVSCTVGESYCLQSKDRTQSQVYSGSCRPFQTSARCSALKPTCDCVPESSYVNCTCYANAGVVTISCSQI
jgi:hypothetical protein